MEKIKDFFYDKNDLVVALVIIVLAGLLIAWRVDIIMDYPQVMAAQLEQQQGQDGDAAGPGADDQSGGADTQTPVTPTPGGATADPSGNTTANGNVNGNANANGGGNAAANGNAGANTQKPKTNTGTVTVTIPAGSSGDKIAQILVDAGVVSSKADFTAAVSAAKADTKLKAGTFQIPANSNAADVVKIITK